MGPIVLSCGRVGTVQIPQVGRRAADDIVMVHGLGANLGFWYAGAVAHFRRFGRVTLFDLPGHGDSEMPETGYGPRALAGVLEELLDHLGIQRAHLVAHSYGGSVALAFALAHPHRVKSLVLADARLWAVEPPEVADEANPRVQRLRDSGLSLADDRYDVAVQILVELARLRLASDDPMAAIGDIMPGARGLFAGRRAARKWLKLVEETQAYAEMTDPDALPLTELARLEMPILGVYAQHSTRADSAEALASTCRRFRLQVVPDVGHFFPLTRPRLFARIALAFFRSLARARRRRRRAAAAAGLPTAARPRRDRRARDAVSAPPVEGFAPATRILCSFAGEGSGGMVAFAPSATVSRQRQGTGRADAGWPAMSEKIKDKDADRAQEQERELDEGLEETFPASDPPAATQPGDGGADERERKPRK